MRLPYIYLIVLFFTFNFLNGQGEASNWYFGENAGLTFNSGMPVALVNGNLNTAEGCAAISDSQGNLRFYTDGRSVYNRDHLVMP
ncbi:MAG: hypothetical protein ABJC32_11505, partial [Nonlabens ulvanivorans]